MWLVVGRERRLWALVQRVLSTDSAGQSQQSFWLNWEVIDSSPLPSWRPLPSDLPLSVSSLDGEASGVQESQRLAQSHVALQDARSANLGPPDSGFRAPPAVVIRPPRGQPSWPFQVGDPGDPYRTWWVWKQRPRFWNQKGAQFPPLPSGYWR